MKRVLSDRKRRLRWSAIGAVTLVASVLVTGMIVVPFVFGFIATLPRGGEVGAPPERFEALTLTTEDVRDHARLLLAHGFGVLAIDQRGHGESGGDTNLFGWQSTRDVGAAVAFLQAQAEVQAIGGRGLSMDGAAYSCSTTTSHGGSTVRSCKVTRTRTA